MTEALPATILSDRPDFSGRGCRGRTGKAVILDDEPDTAYISAVGRDAFYGSWPVSETDIEQRRAAALREKLTPTPAEMLNSDYFAQPPMDPWDPDTDKYIATRLRLAQELALRTALATQSGYLLSRQGKFLRPPTVDEYNMSFEQLDKAGKVAP